jgi:hypothetical protein
MVCEHCGSVFCPPADDPAAPPRLYCDSLCARNAGRTRRRQEVKRVARRRARHESRKLQRAACRRKRHFTTETAALAAWRAMPFGIGGAYKCKWCEDWHITSQANGNGRH